jgi:hypothetical protein
MPTLSYEGSVYYSTAVDRKELVAIAPSLDVDMMMSRLRSSVPASGVHEVHFNDLPSNKATAILFSLSSGDVTVTVTDDSSDTVSFDMEDSGMLILLNTLVTGLTITETSTTAEAVYDLIAGA